MKDGVFFTHQADVYDWYGKLLNPEIRNAITVNNIVRISVNHGSVYSEGIYVQVTAVDGLDLVGIVQDTYRHFLEGEIIYVENGESICFPRDSIIEVPLHWDDNKNIRDARNSWLLGGM
ncbi:hypothetical protein G7B40_023160 [Aetokthonos hydrillicola Thurmond2011]|jgi:uncharacterized protein YegJ (DUF2314 family)|uniref:Uncharacterized protein n=1 Tax=Aetokthonos hydrillicola Thurmond2011 TaxID=2712845 RepID=A0AAP5IBY9_9CYAN|nr:hypothetical protein [Aetokthonos hydrillicola]MBO3461063.1 hypothetical protein [Aetokthonos hydrillicola CCALA 1050]MBW4586316.1 hypothetical protein [Aetokthonos hydrillicola CCALA 1050]MDR9897444.1 hypothetical protein [Aetokthonos hydrillicola Thurmond2011]